MRATLQTAVKKFALSPRLHGVVGAPLTRTAAWAAALSRLSRWMADHPCTPLAERFALHERVAASVEDRPVDYLEFGVSTGVSMTWWVERLTSDARFVGFDTFEGLPERWGNAGVGAYTAHGQLPAIDDARCGFEVGLFHKTLKPYLERVPRGERALVVHLDADIYSSTLYVLATLANASYLRAGDILIFDEFGSFRAPDHEPRAFMDFVTAYGVEYELLGATKRYAQVAVRLLSLGASR